MKPKHALTGNAPFIPKYKDQRSINKSQLTATPTTLGLT